MIDARTMEEIRVLVPTQRQDWFSQLDQAEHEHEEAIQACTKAAFCAEGARTQAEREEALAELDRATRAELAHRAHVQLLQDPENGPALLLAQIGSAILLAFVVLALTRLPLLRGLLSPLLGLGVLVLVLAGVVDAATKEVTSA